MLVALRDDTAGSGAGFTTGFTAGLARRPDRAGPASAREFHLTLGAVLLRMEALEPLHLMELADRAEGDAALLGALEHEAQVPPRTLLAALAEVHGVPAVDLSRTRIDLAALQLVPADVAESLEVLPLASRGDILLVATARAGQDQGELQGRLRSLTKHEIRLHPALPSQLRAAQAEALALCRTGAAHWAGPLAPATARVGWVLASALSGQARPATPLRFFTPPSAAPVPLPAPAPNPARSEPAPVPHPVPPSSPGLPAARAGSAGILRAVRADPTDARGLAGLARLLAASGDTELALATYQQSLALEPGALLVAREAAALLRRIGQEARAEETVSAAAAAAAALAARYTRAR